MVPWNDPPLSLRSLPLPRVDGMGTRAHRRPVDAVAPEARGCHRSQAGERQMTDAPDFTAFCVALTVSRITADEVNRDKFPNIPVAPPLPLAGITGGTCSPVAGAAFFIQPEVNHAV